MNWLAFAVLGRLLTWLVQTSGPTRRLWSLHPFLAEMGGCDLCIGTWVCAGLAWALGCNVMAPVYIPALSEFVTGAAMAFGLHLARLGWYEKFGTQPTYGMAGGWPTGQTGTGAD